MGSKKTHFLNLENSFSILLLFPKSEKNYNDRNAKNTQKKIHTRTHLLILKVEIEIFLLLILIFPL